MNKIKNYLCNADPFDIMAIIWVALVFVGVSWLVGPLRVVIAIGIGMVGMAILILIGFILYKAIGKLQERCKNVQS